MQLADHTLDPLGESFHFLVEFAEVAVAGQHDFRQLVAKLASRIADLDLQPVNRTA